MTMVDSELRQFGSDVLRCAQEWNPNDIFSDDVLREWVAENSKVEDVFSDDDIREYAEGAFRPEEIFSADELSDWAVSNGFVEVEER
jgi:hypothetical protein